MQLVCIQSCETCTLCSSPTYIYTPPHSHRKQPPLHLSPPCLILITGNMTGNCGLRAPASSVLIALLVGWFLSHDTACMAVARRMLLQDGGSSPIINVLHYGAKGDGATDDTKVKVFFSNTHSTKLMLDSCPTCIG